LTGVSRPFALAGFLLALPGLAAAGSSLGSVAMDVTCSAQAKPAFLEGLAALHSFWYEKARASFEAALASDPECRIARWGMAMSHDHPVWGQQDLEAGAAALRAVPADAPLTTVEKALVSAARLLFGDGPKPARARAYADALEKAHAAKPDDAELAAFYSLALLSSAGPMMGPRADPAGSDAASRREKAGKIALAVLARHPDHPGAAHYAIHALDDPPHAAQALDAAKRYSKIAPASAHALHMPAHIFVQLGMWKEAAESNLAAWEASKNNKPGPGSMPPDMHSLEWLSYCYLQLGQADEARRLVDMIAGRAANGNPRLQTVYLRLASTYLIESGRWSEADGLLSSALERLAGAANSDHELSALTGAFLALGLAQPRRAGELASRLGALRQKLAPDAETPPAREAEAARLELSALAATTEAEASSLLGKAAELESRQLLTAGLPAPPKPVNELHGELLLKSGRRADAAARFARELERHPGRALSVKGLKAAR
jgi:hypothetical protein